MAFKILISLAVMLVLAGAYLNTWRERTSFGMTFSVRHSNAAYLCWFLAVILAGVGWITY